MKLTKKKVLVVAAVVCVLSIISMGTLAWFSAKDSVENKFFIADSTDTNPEDIFSVTVWEKTPESGDDTDGYEYKNILPGDLLKKEPHVENTGHYDQYVRVTVTISDAQAWIAALGANFDVTDVFVGFDINKWNHIWNNLHQATQTPEEIVYVMYYKDVLASGDDVTVFTDIQIPTTLTDEQAAAFGGGFTIDVKAEAVQTQNVVPDGTPAEDAAWAAFQTVSADQAI